VAIDSTLVISSNGKVTISLMPDSTGKLETGIDDVRVSTNSSSGYKLYIKDADANLNLVSGGGDTIVPGGGTVGVPAALDVSSGNDAEWGFRVQTMTAGYAGITATNVEIGEATGAVVDHSTPVTFGVLANTSQADGVYTDIVTYTAINQS
jgi:hypothetical protein